MKLSSSSSIVGYVCFWKSQSHGRDTINEGGNEKLGIAIWGISIFQPLIPSGSITNFEKEKRHI
jgi:hypothetical protein